MPPTHQPIPECMKSFAELNTTLALIRADLQRREENDRERDKVIKGMYEAMYGGPDGPGLLSSQQSLASRMFDIEQQKIFDIAARRSQDSTRWTEKYKGAIQIVTTLISAGMALAAVVIAAKAATP